MTNTQESNKVPKKFRNLKRSFMKNITLRNDHSFKSFPKGLRFHGQEQEEQVILIIRSHWIIYVPQILLAILVLVFPWLLGAIVPAIFESVVIFISLLITSFLIGISILVSAIVKWYYNVDMITDQRVVDLDFPNVMAHTMSETQLEHIEDITQKQLGLLGSIFDVGTVYVQTAGSAQNIEFTNVPRPRDVQEILSDLLESKEKG
ncbi:TPA: hypothetical protein DCP76_02690, partial [Patescibacteria group bacterium]|nr:hypothetical protein [Patescibacteria group bacterium]